MPEARRTHEVKETPLVAGATVGEYVVGGPIADGGMSTVYAAVHPLIGKRAAIKVISADLSHDPAAVERFFREARAVNEIQHPNIVDVFACGQLPDGRNYLVMEWLAGETLAARLQLGRLSFGESCEVLVQICDALDAAHDKRIVHLDLKPENVYLVPVHGGRTLVKLLDFGIAKLLQDQPTSAAALPMFMGTPEYASPEQAQALSTIDAKSDCYSLGVMAYELFVGRLPFEAADAFSMLRAHVDTPPPLPVLMSQEAPAGLGPLILSLLDKAPNRRPELSAVRARLVALRDATLDTVTRQLPAIEMPAPRMRRRIAMAASAFLLPLGFGAWTLLAGAAPSAARPMVVAERPLVARNEGTAPAVPALTAAPIATPPVVLAKPKHGRRHKAVRVASSHEDPRWSQSDYLIDYAGNRR
jgi:serine/threonine-protein kinase